MKIKFTFKSHFFKHIIHLFQNGKAEVKKMLMNCEKRSKFMTKKNHLKLSKLKIESFRTDLEKTNIETVKGGATTKPVFTHGNKFCQIHSLDGY